MKIRNKFLGLAAAVSLVGSAFMGAPAVAQDNDGGLTDDELIALIAIPLGTLAAALFYFEVIDPRDEVVVVDQPVSP